MIRYYRDAMAALRGLWAQGDLGLASLGLLLAARAQTDPDYWWHLLVGQRIADSGTIPHTATLSWLVEGRPWVAHEWLDDLLFFRLQQLSGVVGGILFFAALFAAILYLVLRVARLLRPDLSLASRCTLVALVLVIGLPVWLARSQMWDPFFALLAVYGLLDYFEHDRRRWLLAMPLLMVAWANLHGGGVMFYLPVAAALLVGQWLNTRLSTGGQVRPWRPVLLSLGLTLVAISLNPYGSELYLYPLATIGSPAQMALIVEWQSPNFHEPAARALQLLLSVGLIGLAGLAARRDLRAILLAGGLVFLTLQSERYLGLLAPLVLATSGPALAEGARRLFVALWPSEVGLPDLRSFRRRAQRILAPALLVLVLVMLPLLAIRLPTYQAIALAPQQPVAATDYLAAHPPSGRWLNTYQWGGYLAWRLRLPVTFYGAADAFTNSELETLGHLGRLDQDPRPWLDQEQIELVIWQADRPLAQWLGQAPDWRQVYADAVAVIFVRVEPY
jgi:hypothetical protein